MVPQQSIPDKVAHFAMTFKLNILKAVTASNVDSDWLRRSKTKYFGIYLLFVFQK